MAQNKTEDGRINEGITAQYIYSACIITSTPDITILHDPWFTDGVYDGSWFQFPKIDDPIGSIGDVDAIYISHIHPDHYDSKFIKEYFRAFGEKQLLIAEHQPNYLYGKMRGDGFSPTIVKTPLIIGSTSIEILPHKTGSNSDIDSAIIIKYLDSNSKTHCIVNANDIIFDEMTTDLLKKTAGEIDVLFCGYTGAGPYPQTYFDLDARELTEEAQKKKVSFFERYNRLTRAMRAKVNVPFAGKYILGGKLAEKNSFRGVSDPVEVLSFDKKAIVLADNGGTINTSTLTANGIRQEKYSEEAIKVRLDQIQINSMDYERLFSEDEIHQLPINRLLVSASIKASAKSECEEDYYFCFKTSEDRYTIINASKHSSESITYVYAQSDLPKPRSEIIIDPRYLFGLLTHIYHWNNAEVGSQYETRRTPNILNRKAQAFLNHLTL